MRLVSGEITNNSAVDIEPGAQVEIKVIDCATVCGAPAKVVGQAIIDNPLKFPIRYRVEYEDEPNRRFAVCCRVSNKDNKLIFVNDARFLLFDYETGDFLDTVNVHVIKVQY